MSAFIRMLRRIKQPAHELTHTIQHGSASPKQGGVFTKVARSVGTLWRQVGQREPRDQDRLGEHAVGHGAVTAYDSSLRVQYAREADDMAHKLLGDYASGKLSHAEAKANAISRRNFLLNQTRSQLTPGGAALSSLIHPPRIQEWLESKYILRILRARPDLQVAAGISSLDEIDIEKGARFNPEKLRRAVDLAGEELSLRIVRSSGRTNVVITGVSRVGRVAGPVGAAGGLALSGYEVFVAPEGQQLYVAGRELTGITGGAVGAYAGTCWRLQRLSAMRGWGARVRHCGYSDHRRSGGGWRRRK